MAELLAIDTSVLIDQERGLQAAANCVGSLLRKNRAAIHPVSWAEMISGVRDRHHLGVIRSMLSPLRVLPVRNEDFRLAISLLESTVLAHRIGWPDCVIAATCLRLKVPIVTINAADFRPIKGVQVVQPY